MKLSDKMYLTASEVAEMLEVSKSKAYKIIADMNADLEKNGYFTFKGKVSTKYFCEHAYGATEYISEM